MKFQCIKCSQLYESDEDEVYYCESCNAERKIIAAQVDAKYAHRSTEQPLTPLQEYEANSVEITDPRTGKKFSFQRVHI